MSALFFVYVFVGSFFGGKILCDGRRFHKQCNNTACIEIRKCPYFAELLGRSPRPLPNNVVAIIKANHCDFQGNIPKVCCPVDTTDTREAPDVTRHPNLRLLPDDCGPISEDFRITWGNVAGLMEFPWMALIIYNTDRGLDFKCGGTVINRRYVLTAAHCIVNFHLAGVRLGEHNVHTEKDCDQYTGICAPPVLDFYIEEKIVHPQYDSKKLSNDIALLRLATTVNASYENVRPICLPIGDNAKKTLDGRYATVTGWGVTETGHKSAKLRKVSIPLISTSKCMSIVRQPSRQICAGGGDQGGDSCGGDSGGPLQMAATVGHATRYVQFGVVSYGPRHCGTTGKPGVYTRVAYYMDWILDNMRPWIE